MASSSSPQKSLIASSPRHPKLLACQSDEDSGCVMDDIYAWVPPRTKPELVHSFFAALPPDKVPRIGTPGEEWRTRQLVRQQPPQDADARYCGNLSAQEERELAAFARSRAQHDQGRGIVQRVSVEVAKLYCHQCKLPIGGCAEATVAVGAPRHFGALALWHPRCFVCVECQHLLADLAYFVHAQNIFCGRHHAELSKPRCASCDELIFSAECTEAEGRVWHMKHFCCERCGEPLGGKRYVMNSKDAQPMCVPCCRDAVQQMRCDTCAKQIDADRPHIAQGSFRWHADQRCFCCSVCARALLGKPYSLLSNGRLFCGAQGCARKPEVQAPSASPLPPPSFPPPPPPRCSPSLRGVRFNMALMDSALPPPSPATPSVENVYETVAPFPATVSAPSASTSGCSANGSILSSASSSGAANASPHYYQLRRERTAAAAEDAEETRRRCRSADGRAERRRRKSKKQKRPMRNAPALAAPPAGSSLAAALALATSGGGSGKRRRRRQKRSRRRQRRRERRRRERILYGESSSSSDSEDDEDSTFSSASSSASSYSSSSSSSSSSDDDDVLGLRGRRDATAALLREYCMRTALNARVNGGRTQLLPGSPVTPASSSAGTPPTPSGGKTRMARMRSTTAKKTQSNSGNCRIS